MKDSVKRMRSQATDWEKLFSKHISDKGLISKIYKELLKPKNKKAIKYTYIYFMAKRSEQHLMREESGEMSSRLQCGSEVSDKPVG